MQKLTSFEWFRAGTESQIRLLPYAGEPEADLMLTSHTVIANLLCTGCLTLNCLTLRCWQIRECNFTDGGESSRSFPLSYSFLPVCKKKKYEYGFRAVEVWAIPFFEIILFSNAIEINKDGIVFKALT